MSGGKPGRLVGGVLLRGGMVLLGQRSRKKREWPGAWDFPGGHVEPGESFAQALKRETEEEIGVVPLDFAPLADCQTREDEPYRIFLVRSWSGGEPFLRNREHDRLGWFSPAQARALRPLADRRYAQLLCLLALTLRQR